MNERLLAYTFSIGDPTEGAGVGALACYFMMPFGGTIVYVSGAPFADDAGATMDINDDGTGVITAIAMATKAAPGEWISTHCGGTQAPVQVAAGSVISLDFNNAAVANRFDVQILVLTGETVG